MGGASVHKGKKDGFFYYGNNRSQSFCSSSVTGLFVTLTCGLNLFLMKSIGVLSLSFQESVWFKNFNQCLTSHSSCNNILQSPLMQCSRHSAGSASQLSHAEILAGAELSHNPVQCCVLASKFSLPAYLHKRQFDSKTKSPNERRTLVCQTWEPVLSQDSSSWAKCSVNSHIIQDIIAELCFSFLFFCRNC